MDEQQSHSVTIRTEKYVSDRFEEHAVQHAGEKEQRTLLRNEMDRRLEGMNEFRDQLNRQQATFVTRELFDTLQQNLASDVRALNLWRSNMEGRMFVIAAVPSVIAIVATAIAIFTAVM